jgi:hypothetical protein
MEWASYAGNPIPYITWLLPDKKVEVIGLWELGSMHTCRYPGIVYVPGSTPPPAYMTTTSTCIWRIR